MVASICLSCPGSSASSFSGLNSTFQFSGLKEERLTLRFTAEPVFLTKSDTVVGFPVTASADRIPLGVAASSL